MGGKWGWIDGHWGQTEPGCQPGDCINKVTENP